MTPWPSRKGWELGSGTGTGHSWQRDTAARGTAPSWGKRSSPCQAENRHSHRLWALSEWPQPVFVCTHISPPQAYPATRLTKLDKKKSENPCFQNQITEVGKLRLFQPLQSVLRLDLKCCYFKQEFNIPEWKRAAAVQTKNTLATQSIFRSNFQGTLFPALPRNLTEPSGLQCSVSFSHITNTRMRWESIFCWEPTVSSKQTPELLETSLHIVSAYKTQGITCYSPTPSADTYLPLKFDMEL